MPRRLITSEIFRNEKFGNLDDTGRVFFIGCFSNADDDGRLKASPKYLKALLFPYDNDKTPEFIQEIRDHCHQLGLIHVYSLNGADYLYCIGWEEHQVIRKDRHRPSVLPAPNAMMPTISQPTDRQVSDMCQTNDSPNLIQSNLIQSNKIKDLYNNNIGTIFKTFEENFGQRITENTREALGDFVDTYGWEKVLIAMNKAIKHNKRNLAYVEGILKGGTSKRNPRALPKEYTKPEDL